MLFRFPVFRGFGARSWLPTNFATSHASCNDKVTILAERKAPIQGNRDERLRDSGEAVDPPFLR